MNVPMLALILDCSTRITIDRDDGKPSALCLSTPCAHDPTQRDSLLAVRAEGVALSVLIPAGHPAQAMWGKAIAEAGVKRP